MAKGLTTVELKAIRGYLQKVFTGQAGADELFALVRRIDEIIERNINETKKGAKPDG